MHELKFNWNYKGNNSVTSVHMLVRWLHSKQSCLHIEWVYLALESVGGWIFGFNRMHAYWAWNAFGISEHDLEWLGGRKGSHNRLGKIHNSINNKWYACRSTLWQDKPSVVRFDMLCYPCNIKNDMGTHCNDKMNFCVVFLKANITYTYISKYSSIFCFIIYPAVNGQSHRTIPTTWPYNILRYWYGWYWTVVIAQLSAVDLPCKVNDKSRWPRKASE